MKSDISITTQTYFGDHFYYSGWALLILGIPLLGIKWYAGIILLVLGAVLVSSVYKLHIKTSLKRIDDYLFIFGRKLDLESTNYDKLKYVIIKEGRYSQQLNYKSISTVVEGSMYSAYLKADDESYYLGESKNQQRISDKARKIALELQIEFHPLETNPEG